uniref:Matrix Gla protein n=1 Tax=Meloidogyne hapla TaxID=6305 RepID=A0A1I8C2Y4_MELHA
MTLMVLGWNTIESHCQQPMSVSSKMSFFRAQSYVNVAFTIGICRLTSSSLSLEAARRERERRNLDAYNQNLERYQQERLQDIHQFFQERQQIRQPQRCFH